MQLYVKGSCYGCPLQVALTDGSCAIEVREPCQVGNKAALSGIFYVPQGCLSQANCKGNAWQFPLE